MLSRVADSVYWMNRYIERAENIARIIDVNLNMMLDLQLDGREQWEPLVIITGDRQYFHNTYGEATRENVIHFLTFDTGYYNSIISCLHAARENARSIREIISSEMWEQINLFYHRVNDAARNGLNVDDYYTFYRQIKMDSHLYIGLNLTTLSHNEVWHFCRLGRLLERADKTSRILDVKYFYLLPSVSHVGTAYDEIQWSALLKSASAFEMYRKKHGRLTPRGIVEYLSLDREFPRSIRYCLARAEDSLHCISGSPAGTYANDAERVLGKLSSELSFADVDGIIANGLHEYLDNLQVRLNRVGDAIFDTFFSFRTPAA